MGGVSGRDISPKRYRQGFLEGPGVSAFGMPGSLGSCVFSLLAEPGLTRIER